MKFGLYRLTAEGNGVAIRRRVGEMLEEVVPASCLAAFEEFFNEIGHLGLQRTEICQPFSAFPARTETRLGPGTG